MNIKLKISLIVLSLFITVCKRNFDNPVDPDAVVASPSALSVAIISNNQFRITWRDNSRVEDGFIIERTTENEIFQEIGRVSSNQTSFRDNSIPVAEAGMTITYRVSAFAILPNNEYKLSEGVLQYIHASPDSLLLYKFSGHKNTVSALSFSPDGTLLVSGSLDKTLRLWRVSDGFNLFTLTGHSADVNSVAFSPNSSIVASGSSDQTIRLWDTSQDNLLRTLSGFGRFGNINSVAFSPDGTLLASGSEDGDVRLWRVSTGQELRTLSGHWDDVYDVAFSPDGAVLASGSRDGTTRLWQVSNGALVQTLAGENDFAVNSVVFSPLGQLLAAGVAGGKIRFWQVSNGSNIQTFAGHSGWGVISIDSNPGWTLMAAGGADGIISLWSMSDGVLLRTISIDPVESGHVPPRDANPVAFSIDGLLLATGSDSNFIQLWSMEYRWKVEN